MDGSDDTTARVRRAQAGDRAAFETLVAEHMASIEALVRSELGTKLQAKVGVDDLLQETLLSAYRSIADFRGTDAETFRRWLATIARRVVQEQGRRLRAQKTDVERERSLECDWDADASRILAECLEGSWTSPSRQVRRDERFERLKASIESLSEDHRQVILLARIKGLSIKDVAARMERTPNATSLLLLRALTKLREAFGDTLSLGLPPQGLDDDGEDAEDASPSSWEVVAEPP